MKIANSYRLYNSKVSNTNNNKIVCNEDGQQKDNRKQSITLPNVFNKNFQPYITIYNNANLQYKLNFKNNEGEKIEEEINREVDMVLYKEYRLEEQGIEFGSDEFKEWQVKYKNNIPIPLDAPARVRKELCDMITSVKNPRSRYILCKKVWNGFKNVNAANINSCERVVSEIYNECKDYLILLKINSGNSNQFKDVIDYYSEIVGLLGKCKNNIDLLVAKDNFKGKRIWINGESID